MEGTGEDGPSRRETAGGCGGRAMAAAGAAVGSEGGTSCFA